MPIKPSKPIVVPEKSYDALWLTFLSVMSEVNVDEKGEPIVSAMSNFRLRPYSSKDMSLSNEVINVQVPDIFVRIAKGDKELAQIMDLILKYAEKEAQAQGLI